MEEFELVPVVYPNVSVRYVISKTSFSKGTLPKWSKTVHSIMSSAPHSYIIENGQTKKYYELQKVLEVEN